MIKHPLLDIIVHPLTQLTTLMIVFDGLISCTLTWRRLTSPPSVTELSLRSVFQADY